MEEHWTLCVETPLTPIASQIISCAGTSGRARLQLKAAGEPPFEHDFPQGSDMLKDGPGGNFSPQHQVRSGPPPIF
ncbi:hypothetical protein BDV34DRAFT_197857 [Aspergillus parasiticus]|uniref:Uncharacterized protein n=1 Tax=Aspergillus parasiticus TaxID=5067 RepID=A0A5N6DGF6_ASPPA|nr:hypothetical protein BDV34DRAFT_197857 [Aspergillus parasiticus]